MEGRQSLRTIAVVEGTGHEASERFNPAETCRTPRAARLGWLGLQCGRLPAFTPLVPGSGPHSVLPRQEQL